MLSKIADFYEEEVDTAVAALHDAARAGHDRRSSASIVGGIVIAMYLPIFKLVTLIK